MRHDEEHVTVLTRFHDPRKIVKLDAMLFSLLGQDGVAIKSIILGQNIGDDALPALQSLCRTYCEQGLDVTFRNEYFAPGTGDHRAEILNRGIESVGGRYLAFLDYDDVVYPRCYVRLVERLRSTDCAVAFGGVRRADQVIIDGARHTISKQNVYKDLPKARFFIDNQYPIHSYVVDLARVDPSDVYFDIGSTRNEDYAFLYRLLSKYRFDNKECDAAVCEYCIDVNGDNTVLSYRSDPASQQAWASGAAYMSQVKDANRITLDLQDLRDYGNYCLEHGAAQGAAEERVNQAARPSQASSSLNSDTHLAGALSSTLAMLLDKVPDKVLNCYIERRVQNGDRFFLAGWCAIGKASPVAALFSADDGTHRCIVTAFEHRKDVAEHLGSGDNYFGFSVTIEKFAVLKILAISKDGVIAQRTLDSSDGNI
jgi:hypothetical protein